MKKNKIILISICCFWIMIHPQKGYTQSVNKTDSILIKSITDSVFTTIEKSVFSRTDELFYIGIDKNSLAFNYEVVKAIQDASSKYVEILSVQMNDKKIVFNENKNEALYYTNYNLTFKVNPFTFHVDNVRETGVLKLKDNKWEIVQQHASVPVTNDVWPAYLAKEQPLSDPLFKYGVNELKEDFDLFSLALEESHAGLYNYISPQRYKTLTDSIKKELTHPMSDLEFYRLLCPIIEAIKCGHTRISISNQTNDFLNKQNIFIPIQVRFIYGKAYVLKDLQGNTIAPGSEMLSINNRPISEIVSEIFKMQNSDGAITTAKYKKLDEKFHELYSLFIEQSQSFTIQYIPYKANKPQEVVVSGISNNEWWNKINSSNPPAPKLLNLKIVDSSDIAVLDINKFVSQEINEAYGSFQQYMDSAFNVIKTKRLQNLIIDLRGNGGGDISDELIPYLINHPIQYYKTIDAPRTRYSFLEHTDKGLFFNEINVNLWNKFRNENGRYDLLGNRNEYINPNPLVYNGNLFILIDGNSFSATSELASILQDQKRATFFGEETGGSNLGSSSGDFINLTLSHTQIKVTIPIRNYILKISSDCKIKRGIIPDYEISNSISDIMDGNDAEMKFVIDYILKRNK
jgi:C-terminal processing protease CtpA/Prc